MVSRHAAEPAVAAAAGAVLGQVENRVLGNGKGLIYIESPVDVKIARDHGGVEIGPNGCIAAGQGDTGRGA